MQEEISKNNNISSSNISISISSVSNSHSGSSNFKLHIPDFKLWFPRHFLLRWIMILLILFIFPSIFYGSSSSSTVLTVHAAPTTRSTLNIPLPEVSNDIHNSISTSVSFVGWTASAVKLEKTGILPSAVVMGRYLFILGGAKLSPFYITLDQFLASYALRTVNVLDLTLGMLVPSWMLLHNDSIKESSNADIIHIESYSHLPLPPRAPLELRIPAVGTANAVRLGGATYIIGFCTMIPDSVYISSTETVSTFLRSVQVMRLYQQQFAPVDDVTVDIQNTSLPQTATLRFNASCVGSGDNVIYIVGGVSLETGEALASVSQYNVETGQFIDAGWLLDSPLIGPGLLQSNDLLFIVGGFTYSDNKVNVSSMVSVIDPASSKTTIGSYEGGKSLNWYSPQLILYNHTLAVLGPTNNRLFDRLQVWEDLMQKWRGVQEVPIGLVPLRTNALIATVPKRNGVNLYLIGGEIPPPDGSGVSSDVFTGTMRVEDEHVGVDVIGFHYIAIANEVLPPFYKLPGFVHAWKSSAVETIKEKEERREEKEEKEKEEEVLLLTKRRRRNAIPVVGGLYAYYPTGNKERRDEEKNRNKNIKEKKKKKKKILHSEDITDSLLLLSSSSSLLTKTITTITESHIIPTHTPTISPSITLTITPTEEPTPTPTPTPPPTPPPKDLPNNDGNITVYVNGYEPLWYNFTFSILFTESIANACPGIEVPNKTKSYNNNNNNNNNKLNERPCLLRLSDSPTCNEPLLDIGNLTSANAKKIEVETTDPQTNKTVSMTYIAVGPITLVGSLENGIVNFTLSPSSFDHGSNSFIFRRRRKHPSYGNESTSIFYEQLFVYMCFSSGASSLPQCKKKLFQSTKQRTSEKEDGEEVVEETEPCTSALYKVLNIDRPFVLSPVTDWVPQTTTTTTSAPIPSGDNGISTSTIILLVLCITALLVSVLLLIICSLRWRNKIKNQEEEERRRLLGPEGGYEYNDEDDEDEKQRRGNIGRGAALPAHQKHGLLDGKYRVMHRLGRGSFSVVYLVERVEDKQRFALKYVQCADDVDRVEAMRECEVAFALQGHPNVIQLVDMFMSYRFDTHIPNGNNGNSNSNNKQKVAHQWKSPNGSVILRVDSAHETLQQQQKQQSVLTPARSGERYLSLVMAYHEKGDLGKWIRQQKSEPMIPETTIVSIAYQILTVLQFMHRRKPPIIHRDLKPENILLESIPSYKEGRTVNDKWGFDKHRHTESLRIVVTDFGLSRVMDKTFCETGVGSLPYVAPECWQRHYSTKVDIWALGCILYAACAKRVESDNVKVMFSESNHPDFKKKLLDELTQVYGYSLALAAFVVYLLEPDPVRRPSAEEALRLICKRRKDKLGTPDTLTTVSLFKDDDDDSDNNNNNNNNSDEGDNSNSSGNEGEEVHHAGDGNNSNGSGNNNKRDINKSNGYSTDNNSDSKYYLLRNKSGRNTPEPILGETNTIATYTTIATTNTTATNTNTTTPVTLDMTAVDISNPHETHSNQTIIGNAIGIDTSSLGRSSAPLSRSTLMQNNTNTIVDGSICEERASYAVSSIPSERKISRKRQLRLQKLEKYFEDIAEEGEQCEFFIARESPSLVGISVQSVHKSPGNVDLISERTTTPPLAWTPPFASTVDSMNINSWNASVDNKTHNNNNNNNNNNRSGRRIIRETETVDCRSMVELPSSPKDTNDEKSEGNNNNKKKKKKKRIILPCDDESVIVKEPSSSSS